MGFNNILNEFRKKAFSKRDLGDKFENLMMLYFKTDPKYSSIITSIWKWTDFPFRHDFGVLNDIGIDLVAKTEDDEYWAIQCKFYGEDKNISKGDLDTFISTSSKKFYDEDNNERKFSNRLLVSTTDKWGNTAEQIVRNQDPPVQRISLYDLQEAPVNWEKLKGGLYGEISRKEKYPIKPHQRDIIGKSIEYYKNSDRGKLIMACGTGKTFTSLKIAEKQTNNNGLILFLVPSIALVGQALNEWSSQANEKIRPILICSDPKVNSASSISVVDIPFPATTDRRTIMYRIRSAMNQKKTGMTVVFSTYQSIDVLIDVQKKLLEIDEEKFVFDMVICDEAHRTTGVTLSDTDESYFVKVHKDKFIGAKKRLYMTATPRLYSDESKSKAAQSDAVLCSMDDEDIYGDEIKRIGFGEAVSKDLLTDYKVLILTMSDNDVSKSVQNMISNDDFEINADDAAKLIGCINALSKQVLGDEGIIKQVDPEPMKRAVAFTNTIKNSKNITKNFNEASVHYINDLKLEDSREIVRVNAEHIDGSMSALKRHELMNWLKSENPSELNECRVLTNVRCLSEGVDVPSLDSVMFLSARNSQVDVVQSVGRVMRKAPGKKYGYIIIPVVVPSDVEAEIALDNNDRYKVVWTVLNALRAHDDRFNATINKIDLNKKKPDNILIGRGTYSFDESGEPYLISENQDSKYQNVQMQIQFEEIQQVMYAKMVKKVGDRRYWEQWAKSVADIATRQIDRITKLTSTGNKHDGEFNLFLKGLRRNINPSITKEQAIEMLSQHIITKPVFDALFDEYSFVHNNPISISMQKMLDLLEEDGIEKDTETLNKFYESVKTRADGIDNAEGKQRIIIELYDKFFKTAFPKMVEKLGIVYTPVEVVDFINSSINEVLKKEFSKTISDKDVHILDPFTGTGTFITRLLQSGLINKEDLLRKYQQELHANEIVLLAYYIAAVNIEMAFYDLTKSNGYIPFEGICLTDTFQLGEISGEDRLDINMFPKNSSRVRHLKNTPITVIMGNPPYSVGQKSENDNAQNLEYKNLNSRISSTYANLSSANNKNSLYDSYIKAFRWATDRINRDYGGVVAFITNSGWLEAISMDGFRKQIESEFTSIYVYNLKGSVRGKSKVKARQEGQNVFNILTGVAITILVKKPEKSVNKADIFYGEIKDYLNRKEKLKELENLQNIFSEKIELKRIEPNIDGDWINQRKEIFSTYYEIGNKKDKKNIKYFYPIYSRGISTARDIWVYNSSKNRLIANMKDTIEFYNDQRKLYNEILIQKKQVDVRNVISFDNSRISWAGELLNGIKRNKSYQFSESNIVKSLYRPFFKQHLYFDRGVNERVYKMENLFPTTGKDNVVITIQAPGGNKEYTPLVTNMIADVHLNGDAQCFPMYYYEKNDKKQIKLDLFSEESSEYIKRSAITDEIYTVFRKMFNTKIEKEDIFYYVYGVLNNHDYKNEFSNDLRKVLPRIPIVDNVKDFWSISKIGRKLSNLHLHYEEVEPFSGVNISMSPNYKYEVSKMKFESKDNKSVIIYNSSIVVSEIPIKAYDYIINGKSAIEWIMDRYKVSTDKKSGIINNPNDWSIEVGNPRYILDLLLKIINVSVQTVDLINQLPKLKF